MPRVTISLFLFVTVFLYTANSFAGNILVPYVGTITDEGALFDGEANFKLALCTESDTTLWSNDGTSTSCSEPTDSVSVTLTDGVYSFMLGDTDLSMVAIASSIFSTSERIYLRTWFDGGAGFEQFDPDIEVGYSMRSGYADTLQGYSPSDFLLADDQIEATNIADSAVTASKISDGAVTAAKISSFSNSGKTFTLGDASDANVSLVANLGATSPAIRYNTSSDQWEISNDGSSYSAIGSGGGSGDIEAVVAGAGLTGGASSGSATLDIGAGTGITVSADSIAFSYTATQGLSPSLNSGEAIFGTTGIIFEGSTADSNETLLTVSDPGSDVVLTLPASSGTLLSSGSSGVIGVSMMDTMNTFAMNSFSAKQTFFELSTGSGGIVFEGATADMSDGFLTVTDPTAARTWTLPDATGTILLDNMSGDATITSGGALTIANNSVDGTDIALGSDAAGDVMYYDGTDWVRLPKGTDGQVLTLASGVPSWAAASGGGITYTTKTITTSVLAANGDGVDAENFNITGVFDACVIDFITVTLADPGNYAGAQLRVVTYTSDTFATVYSSLIGGDFSNYMMSGDEVTNGIHGFRTGVGGGQANSPVSCYDADGTQELHVKVTNGDSVTGKYTITMKIREVN